MPKLKTLFYEMDVEALINNKIKNSKKWPMLSVGGIVTKSNFLDTGSKYLFPLVYKPLKKRVNVDDKIRVTFFCNPETLVDDEERVTFKEVGAKYELWDDVSEGWSCLYERWEKDSPPS